MESTFRLVATDHPRLLIIDPSTASLKEQIFFKPDAELPQIQVVRLTSPSRFSQIQRCLPFCQVDDQSFIVRYKTREFRLRDTCGSSYWAGVFSNFPHITRASYHHPALSPILSPILRLLILCCYAP
jgi:hypothetical protein